MESNVDGSASKVSVESTRRSERKRVQKRSYSPDRDVKRRYRRQKPSPPAAEGGQTTVRPHDRLADGSPFCCDMCKSPYVCKPSRQQCATKRSRHQPSPRVKTDPLTGKKLTLCNACGLAFDRPIKLKTDRAQMSLLDDKKKYSEEAQQFAFSLVEVLGDADAERLCCPEFKRRPCECIQKYIVGDAKPENSRERAHGLLQLLKEAKRLSTQKVYNLEEYLKTKKRPTIGLGNGQKHSKAFGEYVLHTRHILRDEYKLCERGCQRVLLYSNNFLHKKLKTESFNCRVDQVRSKTAAGRLKPIIGMHREKCCANSCCLIALTHANLLETWRERATSGQAETRRVVAEMLTPSGGVSANCFKFIQWVTAAGYSTIASVDRQMKVTGGDREPPEHGLRRYHRDLQKAQAQGVEEGGRQGSEHESMGQECPTTLHQELRLQSAANHGVHQASVGGEARILPATESVVLEQVNLQGQDVSHLVINNNSNSHLVANNSTSHFVANNGTSHPVANNSVSHLVASNSTSHLVANNNVSHLVVNSSQSHLVERNTTGHLVDTIVPAVTQMTHHQENLSRLHHVSSDSDKIASDNDPARFRTVTRLLNSHQAVNRQCSYDDSEPVLEIDLAPEDCTTQNYGHQDSVHQDSIQKSTQPHASHSTPEKVNTENTNRKTDSDNDQYEVGAENRCANESQQESKGLETDKTVLKSELEVQRKQIELLRKQVAEQQVQLQQQQQLLQSQIFNNVVRHPTNQCSSNIQIPGLPVGLAPAVPQLHNLVSGLPISAMPCAIENPHNASNSIQSTGKSLPSSNSAKVSVQCSALSTVATSAGGVPKKPVAMVMTSSASPVQVRNLQIPMTSQPVLQNSNLMVKPAPQDRQIKPPPPYEVAASSSRQGSMERITPDRCTKTSTPTSEATHPSRISTNASKLPPANSSSQYSTAALSRSLPREQKSDTNTLTLQSQKVVEFQEFSKTITVDGKSSVVVQQLLQAAGEGHVTTLTLTSEQAQEIFGPLSTCGADADSTSNVTVSFLPPDQTGAPSSDGRCNATESGDINSGDISTRTESMNQVNRTK